MKTISQYEIFSVFIIPQREITGTKIMNIINISDTDKLFSKSRLIMSI